MRDYVIVDESGAEIIKATSQWVLVDVVRKRPVLLAKYFPDYIALNERVLNQNFQKMQAVINPQIEKVFDVRYDDIDVNNHVNNAVYPVWALESLNSDFRLSHIPCEIEIAFKKEALYGEKVKVIASLNNNETVHTILDNETLSELALCSVKWQEITLK